MKIFLIAGEASGDLLGGRLIQALRQRNRSIRFFGVGGKRMKAAGLDSLFDISDLAVMGFASLLPRLPKIIRRLHRTVADIARLRPDVVVTIDSPGFNFRLVRRCRRRLPHLPIRYVHYVAPSVWAWHPRRAPQAAELFDHMLTLLPFEPPLFRRFGLKSTYVGCAALEEEPQPPDPADTLCEKGLGLMPGSRDQEIERHMPIFRQVAEDIHREWPSLPMSLLAAPGQGERVGRLSRDWPGRLHILDESSRFFASCRLTLAVSGIATIQALHAGVVPIVVYRTDPFSAMLARRLVRSDYANLVNILARRRIVPEYLLDRCRRKILSPVAIRLLQDEIQREDILAQSRKVIATLKPPKTPGSTTASAAAAAVIAP